MIAIYRSAIIAPAKITITFCVYAHLIFQSLLSDEPRRLQLLILITRPACMVLIKLAIKFVGFLFSSLHAMKPVNRQFYLNL
jgi:hypothetical protein